MIISALSLNLNRAQIFEFTSHFIENIHLRPNGRLLLSSLSSSDLFTIDPAQSPSAKSVSQPARQHRPVRHSDYWADLLAVSGGVHSYFRFDNMHVYVVSVSGDSDSGILLDTISVPDAHGLNGMASLPAMPHVAMSADSLSGCVYRINTLTRVVDVAFADPLLGPGPTFKVRINDLKIFNGYVYFTNSGQGTFARVKINDDGSKAGDIEIVARLAGIPDVRHAYDDFTLDSDGNAYVTLYTNEIVKITQDGMQTTFAGGNSSMVFRGPTSAAISGDGKSIYVATAGTAAGKTPNERVFNGQVIQIWI